MDDVKREFEAVIQDGLSVAEDQASVGARTERQIEKAPRRHRSVLMAASGRVPPTASDRVRMFVSSVVDYEAMSETFPLSTSFVIGGDTRDPADYWRHVMHLALLRKYFFGTDELNLVKVIDSMVELIVDEQPNQRDHFVALREVVDDLARRTRTIYNVDGEAPRGEAGIAIDDLYGRHLHGDYDRWVRTQATPAVFTEMALTFWCADAQRALQMVSQSLDLGLSDRSMMLK